MITAYVYKHTNLNTGEFYIGFRTGNIRIKRIPEEDLPKYICSSKIVKPLILNNPEIWSSEVIACFFDCFSAYQFEQDEIRASWGNPLLLNLYYCKNKSKVFASYIKTDEHRSKISQSLTGKVRSLQHCNALSRANKGKVMPAETIQKIVSKTVGQKRSLSQRANISKSLIGHSVSEETRQKIGNANKGNFQPKGADSQYSKAIVCNESGVIYGSQPEAASALGLKQSDINNVLKGRQKTTKGVSFRYN